MARGVAAGRIAPAACSRTGYAFRLRTDREHTGARPKLWASNLLQLDEYDMGFGAAQNLG